MLNFEFLQVVYSRDEGTSTDGHESKILEKAVHHVYIRIDELEEKLKVGFSRHRTEVGGRIGGTGSRSGSFTGEDGGGDGGSGHGGDGPGSGAIDFSQFNHFMNTQNKQLGIVQQEVNEIMQLMFQTLKAQPSSPSLPSQLPHLPDNNNLKPPHMIGTTPRFSRMESSQGYIPGRSDIQQQEHDVFKAGQTEYGTNQVTDSRSRLPYYYPQSDPIRIQRNEFDDCQGPITIYPLPRVECTTEADC